MSAEAGPVVDRSAASLLTFGAFAFDPRNGILSTGGTEVALPPRVIGVLALLLARRGEVVSRQELLDSVWKDAFVTDTSLAEAVSFLRQALGDDSQAPRYIQTVHRRGYRFVAPVGGVPAAPGEIAAAPPGPVKPSIARELAPWSLAIIFAALALSAGWRLARQPAPEAPPAVRFEIRPSAGSWLDRREPALAMSADGRTIAWSACDGSTGTCGLYVRRLDQIEATRLAGTDDARSPFFSPDGRWIGFFADGKLKKVAIAGGSPVTLADAPVPAGGAWNRDGRIVCAGLPAGGLSIALDQGGEVTMLTTPRPERGEIRHAWPSWLPDEATILFTVVTSPVAGAPGEIAILPDGSKSWRLVRGGVARAVPAGAGHLLLSTGGDLQAVTFDASTLSLTGAPDSVLSGLTTANGLAQFGLSAAGTLVAAKASLAQRRIVWSDDPAHPLNELARLQWPVIAPDGRRAAGVIQDGSGSDIWSADLNRGGPTRVTYGGVNVAPVWCGDRLVYASRNGGAFVPGPGRTPINWPAARTSGAHVFPSSCAPDRRLAATVTQPSGRTAVGIIGVDGAIRIFDDGPFDDRNAEFSPDGEWLAFDSDESGRWDIYLRRLPSGRRIAVSTGGGERPSWSGDGRWIYYHVGDRFERVAGPLAPADASGVSDSALHAPERLFDRPDARVLAVAPRGRLLIEQQPVALDSVVVSVQWLRELRQRLPAPVSAPR